MTRARFVSVRASTMSMTSLDLDRVVCSAGPRSLVASPRTPPARVPSPSALPSKVAPA